VLLGIAVAAVKYVFLLGVLFTAFDRLNANFKLVEPQTLERSKLYRPILRAAEWVFPVVERIQEQASERLPSFREADEADPADAHPRNETI